MKKIIVLFYLSIILFPVFSQIQVIDWQFSLPYAKQLSLKQERPIVIFFTDDPMGTLSANVSRTLANSELSNKIKTQFIPVSVHGDRVLEREYAISKFPTILVLGSDYKETDRLEGLVGSDEIHALLKNAYENYINTPLTSGDTNKNSEDEGEGKVFSYNKGLGSFVKLNDGMWEHRTSFYVMKYKQTKSDNRHYYISSINEEGEMSNKIHLAIPKNIGVTIWVWREEKNSWESAEEITTIDQEVSGAKE